jgi:hypothetical protein
LQRRRCQTAVSLSALNTSVSSNQAIIILNQISKRKSDLPLLRKRKNNMSNDSQCNCQERLSQVIQLLIGLSNDRLDAGIMRHTELLAAALTKAVVLSMSTQLVISSFVTTLGSLLETQGKARGPIISPTLLSEPANHSKPEPSPSLVSGGGVGCRDCPLSRLLGGGDSAFAQLRRDCSKRFKSSGDVSSGSLYVPWSTGL